MIITVKPILLKQISVPADKVPNPQSQSTPMYLRFFQDELNSTIIFKRPKTVYGNYFSGNKEGSMFVGSTKVKTNGELISNRTWTPEMKSFYEQELVKVIGSPAVLKFKAMFWILLGFFIVVPLAYYFYEKEKSDKNSTDMETAKPGDLYHGSFNLRGTDGLPERKYGWGKVQAVSGDTVYILPSKFLVADPQDQHSITEQQFTETPVKYKKPVHTSIGLKFESFDNNSSYFEVYEKK